MELFGCRVYLVNFGHILFDNISQGNRCISIRCHIMLEFPNRIDTIDGSCIGVLRIKAFIKVIIEKSNNATGNCNAHSKNVDQNKQLILQEIPESDKEVVFQHSEVGLELRRGSERKVASFKEHATETLLSVPSSTIPGL